MKQFIAGATVVAMMFLGACSGGSDVVEEEVKVRPAKLVIATRSETSRLVSFPAVINAIESAELTFQIPGEITELNVLEGEIVSRGDVIARLNQRDGQNRRPVDDGLDRKHGMGRAHAPVPQHRHRQFG